MASFSKRMTRSSTEHRNIKSLRSVPWTIGREDNREIGTSGFTHLQWWVNPSECRWSIGTRTTTEKICGGLVHHEWPQTGMYGSNQSFQNSRLDQPRLELAFQAGVITPGGYSNLFSNITEDAIPSGLGNYFDFLDLLDRPDITDAGKPNYINIVYSSPTFGTQGIYLQGFFTEDGVSWTDSAENPNTISDWGASFIVFNSRPKLSLLINNLYALGFS